MPSSEDSAGHNPSRVSIDNGRLQEKHKFSTVKNEITAKNMYAHIYIYIMTFHWNPQGWLFHISSIEKKDQLQV